MPTGTRKKAVSINYSSRDFNSIKEELVAYAKRYYADSFRDFNDASFGSLMLDTVAYVGDVLSFYVDFQANESFLDSAVQYNSIIRLGRQLGYKFQGSQGTYGTVALYVSIPANERGLGPDSRYIPILQRGAVFTSADGGSYILNEGVDFSDGTNEVVVAEQDSTTGIPTKYAIRAFGQVISGEVSVEEFSLGAYKRFPSLTLSEPNIIEIIDVVDSEGNRYFEVDNLSQNVIFAEVENLGAKSDSVQSLLKPLIVPRRYVTQNTLDQTIIQFGYGSEENLVGGLIPDPTEISLNLHGRDYITDVSFDPSKLTRTDALGVAPHNTTLTVVYRVNTTRSANASVGSINIVAQKTFDFPSTVNQVDFSTSTLNEVVTSLEVKNLEPINGSVSLPSVEELKLRILGNFSTQSRAVTRKDYESLIYAMPARFGAIKRVAIHQDPASFKRNVNIHVISEDASGKLVKANSAIKQNLKSWVEKYKMINDTVDILDVYIVNIGVSFTAVAERGADRFDVQLAAANVLKRYFNSRQYDIGERFYISDIYSVLRRTTGLLDVVDVEVSTKHGSRYANAPINIEDRTDPDARYIDIPKNVIVEVKYPAADITGTIR